MRVRLRFPVKLAAIFLVLIAIVGVASVLITTRIFERRQVELDQRLNATVAASMAAEIQPAIDAASGGDVGSIMHYMMVMNPYVEIYLLDPDGVILDYFASPGPDVALTQVDTDPLDAFISGEQEFPILGDNPRRPMRRHHFSAAPVSLGEGRTGYLYVVLRSSGYDETEMELERRYLLEALRTSMLITIVLVGLLGLTVFFLTTRPLQELARSVRAFGDGDYSVRSSHSTRDEIGDLARNFNAMAETIVANVERLSNVDRERRELIANISHDLRNPLATIQGYLETLSQKDQTLTEAERHRYYEILLSSAAILPRLVEDLFELSKLEDPELEPQMEQLSLSELVQDVVMTWAGQASDKGVTIRAHAPRSLNMVTGNVRLLERALINLVRNAVTHTPEGGSIEVSITSDDAVVRVEVADTGRGIPEEDLERVFDRFYIGDHSRARAKDGSGLGLAICRRVVELHGGEIHARSVLGEGSTFTLTIPRAM